MEYKYYGSTSQSKNGFGNVLDSERMPLCVSYTKEYSRATIFGMCRTSFLFFVYVVLYMLFLTSGAAIFSALEAPGEEMLKMKLEDAIVNFKRKYPGVQDTDLEDLITEIVNANNRGVSASANATGAPNWSFGQSVFFATTVVTTIGYGHVTPLSRAGKVFCMIYAIIGIPLTLVLISAFVERLLVPTIWLLRFLNSRLGHLYQPFSIRVLHLFVIVLIFIGVFLLGPAAVFAHIEPDWDYLDSFYYCFISLTTIGLGDYIPGDSPHQSNRPLYKIATTGYLFLGIIFMMLTLAVFYDIPQLNLGLLFTATQDDSNSEKVRLAGAGLGLQYSGEFSPHSTENTHRQVFRVRSRRNDSPSPEETAPIKEFMVP